jgi:acetate kinase
MMNALTKSIAKQAVILVLNTGSSSVKFQLFAKPRNQPVLKLAKGCIQDLGTQPCFITNLEAAQQANSRHQTIELPIDCNHETAIRFVIEWIHQHPQHWNITEVAHRVVHGGEQFKQSVIVTPEIMNTLEALCPLAPYHQPHNLMGIQIIAELMPQITQIACFDTAFHSHHTRLMTEYALPKTIRELGVRRYGFHGLSYQWIVHHLRDTQHPLANQRLVVAHLGNGASLCAIHQGISIDTTMGLTALDGLPMGSRCGSLDPGAIFYMEHHLNLSTTTIENLLYNESGLRGLSNWTNDVKLLQQSHEPDAQFALDYFCMKTAQYTAMMAVSLGGIDGLIFTAGIGENSVIIRDKIIQHLAFLKPFTTWIIPADEEKMMALEAIALSGANE